MIFTIISLLCLPAQTDWCAPQTMKEMQGNTTTAACVTQPGYASQLMSSIFDRYLACVLQPCYGTMALIAASFLVGFLLPLVIHCHFCKN